MKALLAICLLAALSGCGNKTYFHVPGVVTDVGDCSKHSCQVIVKTSTGDEYALTDDLVMAGQKIYRQCYVTETKQYCILRWTTYLSPGGRYELTRAEVESL